MTKSNQKTIFHVRIRENLGSNAVRKLAANQLAGNIYGVTDKSTPVVVDRNGMKKLYEEEGDTGLIYLEIEGRKQQVPVLIDDVQLHPVSGDIQHVVFRRVNLTEKLEADVPVELVGEVEAPGLTVVQVRNELEVRALPTDFPESFEVDISGLKEAGDAVTIADLDFDKSMIEIIFSGDMDESAPLVLLQEIVEEEPEEPETEEVGEGEVPAAPAAGEAAAPEEKSEAAE